jgi:hypothetical protein
MIENTARLLEELQQITAGLIYRTENEYPIEPFVWEVSKQGELTSDKLLESEGYLLQVEIDDIFPQNLKFQEGSLSEEMQEEDLKQMEFINFLRSRCKSVEVYMVRKFDSPEEEFESFPLILAETQEGEWIRVAPEVDADFHRRQWADILPLGSCLAEEKEFWGNKLRWRVENIPSEIWNAISSKAKADFFVRFDLESLIRASDIFVPDAILKRNRFGDAVPQLYTLMDWSYNLREELVKEKLFDKLLEKDVLKKQQFNEKTYLVATEIKEMLLGMKLFARQYYEPHEPVDKFVMSASAKKESVLTSLLESVGFVRTCSFQDFSKEAEGYEGHPNEAESYTRLKPIDRFLSNNLSNLREFVVGCISVYYLYDVGQTSDGDWVGVRTVAIWT